MAKWKIYPLNFGKIEVTKEMLTTGLDMGLKIEIPYLGYYLTDEKNKIVVDTGINNKYIVDGKAWAGMLATGGEQWVVDSLRRINIDVNEIDTIIYTHLHNDHAGNCHLFPNAVHVFQDAEWKELLDPLPSMKIRGDYDQSLISQLKYLKCRRVVGDVEIAKGLRLMLTPGHTAGSQCIIVETKDGIYNITGDTIHIKPIAFPDMRKMELMDGSKIDITPAPKEWGDAVPSSLVYDHYSWYKSIYRIKAVFSDSRYILPGHGTDILGKVYG